MSDKATQSCLGREPFLANQVQGKRVILHACCAPDATVPLLLWQHLADELVVYYYNPNIHPDEEYLRRLADMRLVAAERKVHLIEGKYLRDDDSAARGDLFHNEAEVIHASSFLTSSLAPLEELPPEVHTGLEGGDAAQVMHKLSPLGNEPEGGARCELCYQLRLVRTAAMARRLGFDAFATTLTISPHKSADTVNAIGERAATRLGVDYIWTNFKKREGFKKSIEESRRLHLYRQHYCGCLWSQREQT